MVDAGFENQKELTKMKLKKRLLAFSRRLHARIRKTRDMHKMRCLLINRRSLLLALRLLWKTPIFPSNSRFRSEERFSRNAETDLVCRLLLEKKKKILIHLVSKVLQIHFLTVFMLSMTYFTYSRCFFTAVMFFF